MFPNSCFWDSPLELWYRAFCMWSEQEQRRYVSALPGASFLAAILKHFSRRRRIVTKSLEKSSPDLIGEMAEELRRGQTLAKGNIFDVWQLYPRGSHGCAVSWLQRAIQVCLLLFQILNERPTSERMVPQFLIRLTSESDTKFSASARTAIYQHHTIPPHPL